MRIGLAIKTFTLLWFKSLFSYLLYVIKKLAALHDLVPLYFLLAYADNRREKSLALLTQNFVKLFICSHVSGNFPHPIFYLFVIDPLRVLLID